jgi:sugar/nucleoside kinase (ribokinase family)
MAETSAQVQVIVAGHVCVDIIPAFPQGQSKEEEAWLQPGRLQQVGPAVISLGGAVANTGLALLRLGLPVRLRGKVGNDLFGRALLDTLDRYDPALRAGILVAEGEQTSYSIVLSPPGMDRLFFHHSGANDTFEAKEIAYSPTEQVRLLHIGYPPVMRALYVDGGRAFAARLEELRGEGLVTSLDMSLPDPASDAGNVDWQAWLERVLPHIDIFLPSLEEIASMLRYDLDHQPRTGTLCSQIAQQLLQWKVAVVGLKLGPHGLYLRTTAERARLRDLEQRLARPLPGWEQRELFSPCYRVEVAGTTGAGDCTIAGFLAALLRGLSIEHALNSAVAVGACSVESADATGAIPSWQVVQARMQSHWPKQPLALPLEGWRALPTDSLWLGPYDANLHPIPPS